MLSRFVSPKESKAVMAALADGTVDIVVGTHRLLGKEVSFRDLGLVIIDEEQRFGVAQKERLKALRTEVDVLSMSATPIPRTLNMAFTGLRDISLIESPPRDRQAVETTVLEFSEDIVREAVMHEMERGGQVFFVHNRVRSIAGFADWLRTVVPEAEIVVAHGQMSEKHLEKAMHRFLSGEADVLLATAIIENGLDIPNANTLLVNRSDKFGLAQLYQLRGRVGRSDRLAYAYFLVPPGQTLSPTARARLSALQEFCELGAGFRIAARDLEIRGAGNVLGAEQHGFMEAVGFETYCQLLEEAVAELEGAELPTRREVELRLGLDVQLPDEYIPEASLRLSFYKRLAACDDEAAVDDLFEELVDRYGPAPPQLDNLNVGQRIRIHARRARVHTVAGAATAGKSPWTETPGSRPIFPRCWPSCLAVGSRPPAKSPSPPPAGRWAPPKSCSSSLASRADPRRRRTHDDARTVAPFIGSRGSPERFHAPFVQPLPGRHGAQPVQPTGCDPEGLDASVGGRALSPTTVLRCGEDGLGGTVIANDLAQHEGSARKRLRSGLEVGNPVLEIGRAAHAPLRHQGVEHGGESQRKQQSGDRGHSHAPAEDRRGSPAREAVVQPDQRGEKEERQGRLNPAQGVDGVPGDRHQTHQGEPAEDPEIPRLTATEQSRGDDREDQAALGLERQQLREAIDEPCRRGDQGDGVLGLECDGCGIAVIDPGEQRMTIGDRGPDGGDDGRKGQADEGRPHRWTWFLPACHHQRRGAEHRPLGLGGDEEPGQQAQHQGVAGRWASADHQGHDGRSESHDRDQKLGALKVGEKQGLGCGQPHGSAEHRRPSGRPALGRNCGHPVHQPQRGRDGHGNDKPPKRCHTEGERCPVERLTEGENEGRQDVEREGQRGVDVVGMGTEMALKQVVPSHADVVHQEIEVNRGSQHLGDRQTQWQSDHQVLPSRSPGDETAEAFSPTPRRQGGWQEDETDQQWPPVEPHCAQGDGPGEERRATEHRIDHRGLGTWQIQAAADGAAQGHGVGERQTQHHGACHELDDHGAGSHAAYAWRSAPSSRYTR
jgi:hypothetical protein